MNRSGLKELEAELLRWHEAGRRAQIWWRDDDAVEASAALEKLGRMGDQYKVPITLAVIPQFAKPSLVHLVEKSTCFEAATHGYGHHDHAPKGKKKTELTENPPVRSLADVLGELNLARKIIAELFDHKASTILIPPWNRISSKVAEHLSQCGFEILSTFTNKRLTKDLIEINCHIDLMEWKPVRRGKNGAEIVSELVTCLSQARVNDFGPIGILSHHLVHDDIAWDTCRRLMELLATQSVFDIVSLRSAAVR